MQETPEEGEACWVGEFVSSRIEKWIIASDSNSKQTERECINWLLFKSCPGLTIFAAKCDTTFQM